MKERNGKRFTRILMLAGILLIAAAVSLVLADQISQKKQAETARETAQLLLALMPEVHGGVYAEDVSLEMPVMEIGGTDFAGVLEVPAYDALLPVKNNWEKNSVFRQPSRYAGSMYNGSLIIGGSMNAGQFDFVKWISAGELVTMTDMTGLRTSYLVFDVAQTKDVSDENLTGQDADLVLFARNPYGRDYRLVLCERK